MISQSFVQIPHVLGTNSTWLGLGNKTTWLGLVKRHGLGLKGPYVTFRNCLLTVTPVAAKSTAGMLLTLACVLTFRRPASAKTVT